MSATHHASRPQEDTPNTDSPGSSNHGTFGSYMIGFALSAVLTAVPFWLVMTHQIADGWTAGLVITALAFVQIVVHTIFFLHVNSRAEGGWTLMALMFTAVLIVITISGSLWIMFHLNANMMPMTSDDMPPQEMSRMR